MRVKKSSKGTPHRWPLSLRRYPSNSGNPTMFFAWAFRDICVWARPERSHSSALGNNSFRRDNSHSPTRERCTVGRSVPERRIRWLDSAEESGDERLKIIFSRINDLSSAPFFPCDVFSLTLSMVRKRGVPDCFFTPIVRNSWVVLSKKEGSAFQFWEDVGERGNDEKAASVRSKRLLRAIESGQLPWIWSSPCTLPPTGNGMKGWGNCSKRIGFNVTNWRSNKSSLPRSNTPLTSRIGSLSRYKKDSLIWKERL